MKMWIKDESEDLSGQKIFIERAGPVWRAFGTSGKTIAEGVGTRWLMNYAMDHRGASEVTVLPWAGYHWRQDVG